MYVIMRADYLAEIRVFACGRMGLPIGHMFVSAQISLPAHVCVSARVYLSASSFKHKRSRNLTKIRFLLHSVTPQSLLEEPSGLQSKFVFLELCQKISDLSEKKNYRKLLRKSCEYLRDKFVFSRVVL